jgi:hypothetical protein
MKGLGRLLVGWANVLDELTFKETGYGDEMIRQISAAS